MNIMTERVKTLCEVSSPSLSCGENAMLPVDTAMIVKYNLLYKSYF